MNNAWYVMIGVYMIDAQIRSDDFLPFILGKMMGKMRLESGFTEHDEMNIYKESNHVNYFIPSGEGFLCISVYKEFILIPFAWYDGSFSAQKEMVKLGKQLYKYYTVEHDMPIYYTGLENFYTNHSEKVMDNVWIFKPKNL